MNKYEVNYSAIMDKGEYMCIDADSLEGAKRKFISKILAFKDSMDSPLTLYVREMKIKVLRLNLYGNKND